jgi:hypothetical protein
MTATSLKSPMSGTFTSIKAIAGLSFIWRLSSSA